VTTRRPAVSFLPATAVLELTYRCNHACLFCSCPWEDARGGFPRGDELTTAQWCDVISRLCRMGVTNLALSGGEPLMREDLPEIVSHAAGCETEHIETVEGELQSKMGPPKIYLLSNGRSVAESTFRLCKEHGVQLSMSLPGLETFAAHTGCDGADGVLRHFSRAKELGLKTVANITVTRENLYELDRVISAALLAGAEQVLLNRFLPGGRGLEYADRLALFPMELTRMLDTAEEVLQVAGRFGSLGTEVPKCLVDPTRYKRLEVSTRCSAAIQFFVIGPSGFVRVCNHSPVNLVPFDRIEDLKSNDYWKTFVMKSYLPEACHACEQRLECDGGCREAAHVVGGSLQAPDVMLC
jgi:radical SAM protein with 4Fe4S-binding SPASM domain